MQRMRYFRQDIVDSLKKDIRKNLPWYRGESDAELNWTNNQYKEMSSLSVDPCCFDILNESTQEKDDVDNVIAIYEAFGGLSLQQAAEERIWVYATHFPAKKYTSERWSRIPDDDDKATRYILIHYFVSGLRGLFRDNAVARLWWMGYLASRCADYSLRDTLCILLRESDVRANLLERTSLSMSSEIFNGVIRALGKSLEGDAAIYNRNHFRVFMRMLNRRGGRVMLNTLKPQELDEILDLMIREATQS